MFQIKKTSEYVKRAKLNDKLQKIENASKFLLNFDVFLFFGGVTNETKPLTLFQVKICTAKKNLRICFVVADFLLFFQY